MVVFLPIALALLLGISLGCLLLKFFSVEKVPTNLPLGSMGWPFCGETIGYLKPHKSNSMGSFLQEHCSRYGKIFKSHLFGSPTIVSCDLELNMYILQNEEKLFQASYPKSMHGVLGKNSMILVHGDLHKKLRNFAVSFISGSKLAPEFLLFVEKSIISMMESWEERKEVFFCKEAKQFTFNLMVKHLLSITPEEPIGSKILEDFLTFMKGFVSLPIYFPGTSYAKAVKARKRISSTVKEILKERENGNMRKGDFLDVMLSTRRLSDEEIVANILDILLGGYETTASLMALIIYFLNHAPHALEKLKEEHQTIRKNKEDGEPLNLEDYKKMEFTSNVIHEALRCGNIVKFLHRKAIQDVKFKGYLIPSGWNVFPIFTAAHLDPSLHENPTEFNPWRWADPAMSKKMTPFGGGPRLCPGAELAKVETSFFLHHLVLNYRWKIKGDDFPLAYPYLEFHRGLPLEVEPTEKKMKNKL
ncbi:hypothetical protein L1049_003152 [Liquidambar formosana]|uniref:Cytochrome P450 724B1 n=1 Tax=Liquidambar formosana TaxID=63359 RepID=A0AAP0R7X9_LIQFO